MIMPSSDGKWAFVSAVLGKGSIYNRYGAATVSWPSRVSGVDNTELNKVSSCGLGVVNTVAKIDGRTTSWRCTIMTLMTMGLNDLNIWLWWGAKREKLSVQRFMFAIATKRSVAKSFDRSWAYFLEHGPRTNTRWMSSPHWLFESLDYSREFLRLRLPLGWQEKELAPQGRRDLRHEAKSTGISKRQL
jgi:hypothetical protein